MHKLISSLALLALLTIRAWAIDPFPSAPLCPSHNNRAWHSLWDSVRGCHYDHHHGDDPNSVNDIFGTNLLTLMGGTISHPWQTFSSAGLENDVKHTGYFWHVRRGMPCDTSPCITAFRMLVHQHPTMDSAVRYHSYAFEAATSDGGRVMLNGWADFGDLFVSGVRIIDEPDNTDSNNPNSTEPGRHKQHQSSGTPQQIWYGASRQTMSYGPRGFLTISPSLHDSHVYTNPADPADSDNYVCATNPNCPANATLLRPHLVGINAVTRWPFIDADGDSVINWSGYADRYGILRNDNGCSSPSTDCAPVSFSGIRWNQRYFAANAHSANSFRDYDIYFNGRTSGWSRPGH